MSFAGERERMAAREKAHAEFLGTYGKAGLAELARENKELERERVSRALGRQPAQPKGNGLLLLVGGLVVVGMFGSHGSNTTFSRPTVTSLTASSPTSHPAPPPPPPSLRRPPRVAEPPQQVPGPVARQDIHVLKTVLARGEPLSFKGNWYRGETGEAVKVFFEISQGTDGRRLKRSRATVSQDGRLVIPLPELPPGEYQVLMSWNSPKLQSAGLRFVVRGS